MYKIKVLHEDGSRKVFYFKMIDRIRFNNGLLSIYETTTSIVCISDVEKFTVKQLKGE